MQRWLQMVLDRPRWRAAAYVAGVAALYGPTYLIGRTPPLWVTGAVGSLLMLGAMALHQLSSLTAARAWLARHSLSLVLVAGALVCVGSALYTLFQYNRFVPWVDSPKFARALWLVLQGRGIQPVLGLDVPPQTHVTPTLLLVLPWYALMPSHLTLLLVRTVWLCAAAIPLFLVARRLVSGDIALLIALAYLGNFTILYHLTGEYYELQLFPTLFLLSCWWFERRAYGWWLCALWLIGGIREEMGLVILCFALLARLRGVPRSYWLGAMLIGVGWLFFSYELILGLSRGDYAARYHYVFSQHATGLSRLLNRENAQYLYHSGLPFALLLPWLGWSALPVLPVVLGSLLAGYPLAKVSFLAYGIPVATGCAYATVQHLARLTARLAAPQADRCAALLSLLVVTLSLSQTIEHVAYEKSLRPPLDGTLSAPVPLDSPIRRDPESFRRWIAALREAVRRIPDGHQAAAPAHVIAHLPHQPDPLDYGYERLDRLPEYVLVDDNVTDRDLLPRMPAVQRRLRESYQVVYAKSGVVVYSRRGAPPKGIYSP